MKKAKAKPRRRYQDGGEVEDTLSAKERALRAAAAVGSLPILAADAMQGPRGTVTREDLKERNRKNLEEVKKKTKEAITGKRKISQP